MYPDGFCGIIIAVAQHKTVRNIFVIAQIGYSVCIFAFFCQNIFAVFRQNLCIVFKKFYSTVLGAFKSYRAGKARNRRNGRFCLYTFRYGIAFKIAFAVFKTFYFQTHKLFRCFCCGAAVNCRTACTCIGVGCAARNVKTVFAVIKRTCPVSVRCHINKTACTVVAAGADCSRKIRIADI